MKVSIWENIYNREKFFSQGRHDLRIIDGVEYMKVFKENTKREVLIRRDFLRKLIEEK